MTRSVASWTCLVVAIAVVGCTKSPPSPTPPTPGKDVGRSASPAPDRQAAAPASAMEATPAAPVDTQPAPEMAADSAPGGATQPDMTPPADATPAAPKLPYEDLVAALKDEQAANYYRQIEEQLAKNPGDAMVRVNRAWFLNSIGKAFRGTGNLERGLEAFQIALEQVQSALVNPQPPIPDDILPALSEVFYNGACAQSLGGKPEEARVTLQQAIEMGFTDLEQLRNNAELAAVRALPGFDQQLDTWATVIAERLAQESQKILASGETFPFDFAATDLSGANISLAGYLGKVVIVDLWGTWCPPCREEIPSFVRLQTEYGPQGLQIVGLNYEQGKPEAEAKEIVTKFIQENGVNYPCAMLTQEIDQQVPDSGIFPRTLFIDRTGKVRAKINGAVGHALLEAIVKTLLAEAAAPPAPIDTPPAAPSDTPPAAPAETPPAGEGAPPIDTPAEPGK